MSSSSSPCRVDLWLFLLSLVAGLLAISCGSFWIDEGNAAYKAIQPTFSQFWSTLIAEKGSDAQMPLYMFHLWEWEKLFGRSEWTLRLANLPFWLLANGALLMAARRLPAIPAMVARTAVFLACLSPFLWQYLDEARPYIMQYAGGTLLLAFLLELSTDRLRILQTSTVWKGAAAVILLAGGSLLGVSWVAAGGLITAWLLWQGREAWKPHLRQMQAGAILFAFIAVLTLGALGLYYLKVLADGGGASKQGNTIASLGFIIYEAGGFLGLGPGRLELREGDVGAVIRPHLPWLALGALGMGLPLLVGAWRLLTGKARECWSALPGWLIVFCLPLAFTLVAGVLTEVRLLGRHMAPGFILLLWLTALLLTALRVPGKSGRPAPLWLWLLLPIVWGISAGQFRWSSKPQRDDYRTAAQAVLEVLAQEKPVIWAADSRTGYYYGLPLASTGLFQIVVNSEADPLAEGPALVARSRPDIYDAYGAIDNGAEKHGYSVKARMPGFTLYERSAASSAPASSEP